MRIRNRGFKEIKAKQIEPDPLNWRTHGVDQQAALTAVLEEIGFVGALLVRPKPKSRTKYLLIDGHERLSRFEPDALVPCIVVDLDEQEARKALATYDPITNLAGVDRELLERLTAGIEFEQAGLNELVAGVLDSLEESEPEGGEEPPAARVDQTATLNKKWQTKPGQLWKVGNHRLLCGDSRRCEEVSRLFDGCKPFLMVTDPPYGVEYDPSWRQDAADAGCLKFSPKSMGQVANDDQVDWTESYRLFPGDVAYVWHAGIHAAEVARNLQSARFECRTQIIWKKPSFAISRGHYNWQHEPCWYAFRKNGKSAKWNGDNSQSTIWDISNQIKDRSDHGTEKPLECMARAIRHHGDADDDVYDPFLGSGTTMVAAEELGRRCLAMELDPKYCAVILERMAGMGLEPELVD